MRAVRDQRGTAALELVLVIPGLVLLLGVMIGGGRLWFARSDVTQAAYAAARAASLARTGDEAVADGQHAGADSLSAHARRCTESSVRVDAAGFRRPAGTPAAVSARLTCRIPLADLLVPGLPGSLLVAGQSAAPLDTYRGRT